MLHVSCAHQPSGDSEAITAQIGRAAAAGAKVVLLTEEDFTGGSGLGEKIDGPMVTSVQVREDDARCCCLDDVDMLPKMTMMMRL